MARSFFVAVAAAVGSVVAVPAAQAAVYDFSYTGSGGVVSGTIIGALQPDNNTIDVSAIINPEFNGAPGPAVLVITTIADFFGRPGPTVPELTLDGTRDNVLACTTAGCSDGFFFDQAGVDAHFGAGVPEFAVGPSYGNTGADLFDRFTPANMSISEGFALANTSITPVPEPATWATMLTGMAALGLLMRRRRWSGATGAA